MAGMGERCVLGGQGLAACIPVVQAILHNRQVLNGEPHVIAQQRGPVGVGYGHPMVGERPRRKGCCSARDAFVLIGANPLTPMARSMYL